MTKKPLDLATLLNIPYVEPDIGFDISPDGKQVAFSWNKTGLWEIYTKELNSNDVPGKLTSGPGGKFNPRWSPDGKLLAYMLDLDGGENYDLYIFDPTVGSHTNLTPNTDEAIGPNFAWSPDGKQFAFCSNQDGCFETYIMAATGGEWKKVLAIPQPDWHVDWSPDGEMLLVEVEGQDQAYWTYIVPMDGGQPYPVSLDGKTISAKDACWSPDNNKLAFSSNVKGAYNIGIYALETREISWLTDSEIENEGPDWSADGNRLAYVNSQGPTCELAVFDIAQAQERTYLLEPGVVYPPRFTPDSNQLLFIFDNPRHPCDLWTFDLTAKEFKQLVNSLPPEINQDEFQLPQQVSYPSIDGTPVPALLYQPTEKQSQPPAAVIYIHGGPNWLTLITWDPLVQHMVSRGWVVLAPNYRGSTGYGRDWQLASRFDLGGVDTQDVVAGAEYLAAEKIAAPDRIGVTGRSWGGYLTMTCLTQYPDHWAVGAAVVPFLNWFTSHENSRDDLKHWDQDNFGSPDENYDLWYERSPYFFMDRINAPVQLVCGAHDVRCPASESRQAFEELQKLGKDAEYLIYEDEGHSFLKTENQIDSKQRVVAFLAKYLDRKDQS